jgi:hypothetical protein
LALFVGLAAAGLLGIHHEKSPPKTGQAGSVKMSLTKALMNLVYLRFYRHKSLPEAQV